MTILALRSLHAILGDAIEDIERVYTNHGYSTNSTSASSKSSSENLSLSQHRENHQENGQTIGRNSTASTSQAYVSPPPSPSQTSGFSFDSPVDFPSLDTPYNPGSVSEGLTAHPAVQSAISRIVAAAGQMAATVQNPFLTICDATMGYHLPSCMRLLEASHVVEILREAGPQGLHVEKISEKNGVKAAKLAHSLRLLATHHILREVSPDVFTLNRISSLVDSGKTFSELKKYEEDGMPEMKYRDTTGVAAFVGLCTDEIQKASSYMTETYHLSPSKDTREGTEPSRAPFCFAFDTIKSGSSFFGWLEGEALPKTTNVFVGKDACVETGQGGTFAPTVGRYRDIDTPSPENPPNRRRNRPSIPNCSSPTRSTDSESRSTSTPTNMNDSRSGSGNPNRFRLERFGKAMSGTDGWEAPGAALNGFDWHSLPRGSVVVDVGGGIGSTSMLLATAFSSSADDEGGPALQFIIQDRPVVCEMGEKAWKAKCPELLESTARFQVHDFFTPQPIRNAAVFLLRVVLHDWPDKYARKILLRLREAATPQTKLVIADFVLPLACTENMSTGGLEGVEGAETAPVPLPLLPNLGKACANVYWMDLTMQTMFNSQERTLRELVSLAASAGWKITKVSRTAGSLFGYLVAEPTEVPEQEDEFDTTPVRQSDDHLPHTEATSDIHAVNKKKTFEKKAKRKGDMEMLQRASSRCGTPTFGSNTRLSSVEEALTRFGGGGTIRPKGMSRTASVPSAIPSNKQHHSPPSLKPALSLSSTLTTRKKKPSPLSMPPPLHSSPSPVSSPSRRPGLSLVPSFPSPRQPLGSIPMTRRMSMANLRTSYSQNVSVISAPPLPLPISPQRQPPPSRLSPLHPQSQVETQSSKLRRRASHAQLSHSGLGAPFVQEAPVPPLPLLPPLPPPSMLPVRVPGLSEPASLHTPHKNHPTTILGSPTIPSSRVLSHTASSSRKASTAHHQYTPSPVSSASASASFRKRSRTVVGSSSSLRDGLGGSNLPIANIADAHVGRLDPDVGVGTGPRSHVRHISTSMLHLQTQTQSHPPARGGDGGGINVLAAAARIESMQPAPGQDGHSDCDSA